MLALELNSAELAKSVGRYLLDQGIIVNRTHETVLRFLPPYIIETKHVNSLIRALDAALREFTRSSSPKSQMQKATARSDT